MSINRIKKNELFDPRTMEATLRSSVPRIAWIKKLEKMALIHGIREIPGEYG